MSYSIVINLAPELDKAKFDSVVNEVKSKLQGSETVMGVTPKIDDSKIKNEAKKTGETAGTELGKGIENKVKSFDFGGIFGGILSVLGGNILASGLSGLVGGLESVVETGMEGLKMSEYLSLSFKQAGLSGDALNSQLERTGIFVTETANRFAVAADTVEGYSQKAALLGGATGKANEDITTLAVGIEKATNGMIAGDAVVKIFTKGLGDDEAVANLGRLTKAFPQLATALKDIKDPAELTKKALESLSPTFTSLEGMANSPIGSLERIKDSFDEMKEEIGKNAINAFAPLIVEIGNVLIPAIAFAGDTFASLSNFIITNSEYFKVAGISIGVFATAMWVANGGALALANSVISSATGIVQKLVPSLFIQAGATEGATAAQWSLNAALEANPVGLIIAAVVALGAAMYLLYENVEPVRNVFDAGFAVVKGVINEVGKTLMAFMPLISEVGGLVWTYITIPFQLGWAVVQGLYQTVSSLVSGFMDIVGAGNASTTAFDSFKAVVEKIRFYIDAVSIAISTMKATLVSMVESGIDIAKKLLSLDFAGAADSFANAGKNAGKAFSDNMDSELNKKNWGYAAEFMQKAFDKGLSVKVNIDQKDAYDKLVNDYETVQKRIAELKLKPTDSMTSQEKSEYADLEAQALKTSTAIAKLAPDTKENIRTAIDASGALVEVYDINIKKAKEFSIAGMGGEGLKKAQSDYSAGLLKQSEILDSQQNKLKGLKIDIDKTNDPGLKQHLIDKYNEESGLIEKNRIELVEGFTEGGKAGLITEDALSKIAKQMGVSNDEAKKMILAKVLEDASKAGTLTEDQIKKIAIQYGVSEDLIKSLLVGQKKITDETNKTKQAAQSWGDSLSEASKAQKDAKDKIFELQLKYNKGLIDQATYEKGLVEQSGKFKEGKMSAALQQKAIDDIRRKGIDVSVLEAKEAEKAAKAKKENQQTILDIARAKFESDNNNFKITSENSKTEVENERLKAGIVLNEIQLQAEKLQNLKDERIEAERQVTAYQAVVDAASMLNDKLNNKKTQNDLDTTKKKLQELQSAVLKASSNQMTFELKIFTDDKKINEEIEKIKSNILSKNLEFQVKLGLAKESDLLKNQVDGILKDIKDTEDAKRIQVNLGVNGDTKQIAQYEEKIAELNRTLADTNKTLDSKLIDEKLSSIVDLGLREREIALRTAQVTYDEDIKKAQGNISLKEKAYQDFVQKKLDIDEAYIKKSNALEDIALNSLKTFSTTFASALIAGTIDPLSDAITKLQGKIDDLKKPRESDTKALDDEEKALTASYAKREIKAAEFQSKLAEINKKREEAAKKDAESNNLAMLEIQKAIATSMQAIQQNFDTNIKTASDSLKSKVQANIDKLRGTYEDGAVNLADIFEGTSEDVKNFAENAVGSSVANFGALLASGMEMGEAFRKGMLLNLVKTAEQAILANIPLIYSTFMGWIPPPFGFIAATGAIGVVYAALEVAKSQLGRKTGEVKINGKGSQTSDDNMRFLSRDESVLTAEATLAPESEGLYKWQNKTGGSPVEYFTTVNPEPMRRVIEKIIENRYKPPLTPPYQGGEKKLPGLDRIIANSSSPRNQEYDNRELVREFRDMKEEFKKGNFSRREHSTLDVNVGVDDKELVKRVKLDRHKAMKSF